MIRPKTNKKPIDLSISKSLSETAKRISYLTDDEFKKLKIKSINAGISIMDLIDKSLEEIMSDGKYQFEKINVDSKKRSFAISETRLRQMKIFLLNHDGLTQDSLIYNAVLRVI